jgi:hypothetical protein
MVITSHHNIPIDFLSLLKWVRSTSYTNPPYPACSIRPAATGRLSVMMLVGLTKHRGRDDPRSREERGTQKNKGIKLHRSALPFILKPIA